MSAVQPTILLARAYVQGHKRSLPGGKTIWVKPYHTRVIARPKGEPGEQADLFGHHALPHPPAGRTVKRHARPKAPAPSNEVPYIRVRREVSWGKIRKERKIHNAHDAAAVFRSYLAPGQPRTVLLTLNSGNQPTGLFVVGTGKLTDEHLDQALREAVRNNAANVIFGTLNGGAVGDSNLLRRLDGHFALTGIRVLDLLWEDPDGEMRGKDGLTVFPLKGVERPQAAESEASTATGEKVEGGTGSGRLFAHERLHIEETPERTRRLKVESAADVARVLKGIDQEDRERSVVLHLAEDRTLEAVEVIAIGTLSSTAMAARELFKAAMVRGTKAVIAVHNHPSGNVTPSREDREVTRMVRETARALGITFVDHVVLGAEGSYYSFDTGETGKVDLSKSWLGRLLAKALGAARDHAGRFARPGSKGHFLGHLHRYSKDKEAGATKGTRRDYEEHLNTWHEAKRDPLSRARKKRLDLLKELHHLSDDIEAAPSPEERGRLTAKRESVQRAHSKALTELKRL